MRPARAELQQQQQRRRGGWGGSGWKNKEVETGFSFITLYPTTGQLKIEKGKGVCISEDAFSKAIA